MKAALVGASDFNAGHFACQRFDFVVAVDGGYAHLQTEGVMPDAVVGDFDSLGFVPAAAGESAARAAEVRCFPPEKDESDMELAFRMAAERGCDDVTLYGALGRRLDHTLANLQVMLHQARAGRRVLAVSDEYAVAVLHGAPGKPGVLSFAAIPPGVLKVGEYRNFISVFAWGGPATGVTLHGLKYPLDNAAVPDDVSLGLSNEFTGRKAQVRVGHGSLIVTFSLAAWDYLEE